jgi:transglutaminase-like putative cysteine protease
MDLVVRHTTSYLYHAAASRISLLLKLFPTQFDGQSVHDWTVTLNGKRIEHGPANSFGDDEAHAQVELVGRELVIEAAGVVRTQDRNGSVKGLKREVPRSVFRRMTPLTTLDDGIRGIAEQAVGGDTLSRLHDLSRGIRQRVAYQAGVTGAQTSAAAALALGQGVCQDHAHIFVSAARSLGIPARYVAGYYLADSAENAVHETHAWAEAYVNDLGWIGFDITNGVCTTDHYIRLCAGLDAHDAAPVRGAVFGGQEIAIDADVLISEADAETQQRLPQQQ